MSDFTPTTDLVHDAVRWSGHVTITPAEFDRWLKAEQASAWDRGYVAGGSHCRRSWSDEPGLPDFPNPYRTEAAS